ncbi:DUF58 domain-containing protein [bacterium]|nr:DUF58 domain-containing protein [bacterium]
MIFTTRFVILLVIGALMIGFSGWSGALVTSGIVIITFAAAAAAWEWLWIVRGKSVEVMRVCDEKLSLGVGNPVRLVMRNSGYRHVNGIVRDEYPEGFDAHGNVVNFILAARSEWETTYHLIPPKRGNYEFMDIYVRLFGPLGLVIRQYKIPARQHCKVYPNLLDMRRYEIGLRREHAIQPGQRFARIRGRGTEFESLRDYMPDDEFRAIDWKASARRGRLVTRIYQQERSQNILIVLDCGRIMGPVIDTLTRLDHSINASMMLAHVAAIKGDKVGLMTFGEDITNYSPPKAGKSQTLSLLRLTYNLKDAEGDSNYYRAIPYLSKKWTRRSLIVFFTDLVDPESSKPLISQIASLTKKHLCLIVTMADPAVTDAVRTKVENSEDAFNAAAARQVLQSRKQAAAHLVRSGAIVLDVPPEKFTPSVINEYLNIKGKNML